MEESKIPYDRYFDDAYFSNYQWMSYRCQVQIAYKQNLNSILEVGVGNGVVSAILKTFGNEITTFDINPSLKPDVVGDLLNLNDYFEKNSFDMILIAEVLEHLPFNYFERCLEQLSYVANKRVIVSLPRSGRYLAKFLGYVPRNNFEFNIRLPFKLKSKSHHWEIDYNKETSLENLKLIMSKHFKIIECDKMRGSVNHVYFVLEPK